MFTLRMLHVNVLKVAKDSEKNLNNKQTNKQTNKSTKRLSVNKAQIYSRVTLYSKPRSKQNHDFCFGDFQWHSVFLRRDFWELDVIRGKGGKVSTQLGPLKRAISGHIFLRTLKTKGNALHPCEQLVKITFQYSKS
jgi:hypothetical protein